MSDTPETDAMEYFDAMCDPHRVVEADFARKLERERDRYQEQADALVERLGVTQVRMIDAERERDEMALRWERANDSLFEERAELKRVVEYATDLCCTLRRERTGWREAAYSLAEAIPASWDELQPPAEQLRKFKEMVALQNEKNQKSP